METIFMQTLNTMASAQGNGVLLVTHCVPAVNGHPLQQNTLSGQDGGWLQNFRKGEPKSLGVVQIMIGIIHVGLGGILCSMNYFPIAVFCGLVFWAPCFYIFSGALSIAAENSGIRYQVKGALGMNTASTIVTSIAFIIYVIDLWGPFYYYTTEYEECYQNVSAAQNGIMVVLLLLSVLEFAVSISTSAFGCKSVCRHSGSQEGQPMVPNAYEQDPMIQGMGPVMTMAQQTPMVQGMPTSYIGPMIPGLPLAPAVPSERTPRSDSPPSYYMYVPGDTPKTWNEALPNP